jgi:hypothetical protein
VIKENGFTSYNTDVDLAWYKSTTPRAHWCMPGRMPDVC